MLPIPPHPHGTIKRHENGDGLSPCSDQFPPLVSLASNYPILCTESVALDEKTLHVNTRVALNSENIELRLPKINGSKSVISSSEQGQLFLARLPAMNGL
ncbi:uncharacterized protein TrAFT101_000258 [Trichoderma asperellum]|uniref:uncharacterized protein n=1 Tax=Trichoderma asperellum TaxID=101201 RepID=UPI00331FBDB6|nr:hypothetical protein TrAFT101_000258 [Trichoderma asperellum]